ncbi:Hsp20/alpha crystallin family protein [Candidatus Gracilibacteria bacterium]|nr:Hsp20/alpha crystallin family protein [Candidatus Gracilibacteria bacterium]
MFKIYGVTDTDKSNKTIYPSHNTHPVSEHHNSQDIDVDIHDNHDHETDIGQIAVDILDTPSSIIIVAPIAGVDPADIDIGLSRNILTVSGNRKESPIYLDSRRMLVEECFYGAFSRSIILPENLGFDEIKATVEHNVIMITIPKLTLISKSIKVDR